MGTRAGAWVLACALAAGSGAAFAQGMTGLATPLPERPGMLNPRNAGRTVGRWEGVLPDRRCGGVRTEVRLLSGLDGPDGLYSLSERCVNDPPGLDSRVSRGRWQVLRGSRIFQLLDGTALGARNFALQSDGSLHELDAQLDPEGPSWRWRVLSPVR